MGALKKGGAGTSLGTIKMYTKCLYNVCVMFVKCIHHFSKLLHTFFIQNLATTVLLILYIKCIKKFVKIWYTFCIHQLYTSCTIFVYKMYTQFLCGYFQVRSPYYQVTQCNLKTPIPVSSR